MQAPILSRKLVSLYAWAWVLVYGVFYFFLRGLVPEKYLRDAGRIQDLIQTGATAGTSYKMTALLLGYLPVWALHVLTATLNACVLYCIASTARTLRGIGLQVLVLAPLILLCMMAPTKETFVAALALLVYRAVQRFTSGRSFVIVVALLYGLYGGFIRHYFLLILVAFLGILAVLKTPRSVRWLYLPAGLIVLLLLPDTVFTALQGTRDQVNFRIGFGSKNLVRTFFTNPFPPDNALHFLANYGYAFVRLHLPFLFDLSVNEAVLFVNVLIYGWLLAGGIKGLCGPPRLMCLLFLAHISVLILFEPDVGSYFRHFSSVLLYLAPAWVLREERYAAFGAPAQGRSRDGVPKK